VHVHPRQAGKATAYQEALRLAALDEDRRMREEAARVDPSRCPCGGRHYPSADACRWCKCHDPLLRYHSEIPPQITETIRLTEDQERIAADARRIFGDLVDIAGTNCMWCDHPAHPDGDRCVRSAEGMPGNPDGSRFMCGCVAGIEVITEMSYRPCSVCGAPDHAGVVHDTVAGTVDGIRPHRPMSAENAAVQERAYRDMSISPETIDEIMDSSPTDEIVVCGMCGHSYHGAGDGRCAFQVASRMQDEGFHVCPCGRDGDS